MLTGNHYISLSVEVPRLWKVMPPLMRVMMPSPEKADSDSSQEWLVIRFLVKLDVYLLHCETVEQLTNCWSAAINIPVENE